MLCMNILSNFCVFVVINIQPRNHSVYAASRNSTQNENIKESNQTPKQKKAWVIHRGEDFQLFNASIYVCEFHSCYRKCGIPQSRNGYPGCSCHVSCETYGTCCLDYGIYCKSPGIVEKYANSSLSSVLEMTIPEPSKEARFYECTYMPVIQNDKTDYINVMVISKCPVETEITIFCETNITTSNVRTMIPVSSNGTIFKNAYCAECHGLRRNDISSWSVKYSCHEEGDSSTHEIIRMGRIPKYAKQVSDYVNANCRMIFKPPQHFSYNNSHCRKNVIRQCSESFLNNKSALLRQRYIDSCDRYANEIDFFHRSFDPFKNPHCAICNDLILSDEMCNSMESGSLIPENEFVMTRLPSFQSLFDFSQTPTPQQQDTPSQGQCTAGEELIEGACFKVNITVTPLPQLVNKTDVGRFYSLRMRANGTYITGRRMRLNTEHPMKDIAKNIAYSTGPLGSYAEPVIRKIRSDSGETIIFEVDTIIEFRRVFTEFDIAILNSKINNTIGQSFHLESYELEVTDLHLSIGSSKDYHRCKEGRYHNYHQNQIRFPVDSDDDTVIVENTKTMYDMSELIFGINLGDRGISYNGMSNNGTSYNASGFWIGVCETRLDNCSKIVLNVSEVTVLENETIYVPKYDKTIDYFEKWNGNMIVACADWIGVTGETGTPVDWSGIISMAGTALSQGCLLLTVITYLKFPTLRTVPGKSIMNLAISLILSQLTFQLSGLPINIRVLCVTMAAVQHYLWLVGFVWMSILAYDLSSTFSGGNKMVVSTHKEKMFRNYCLVAWLCPAAVVITCVSLHMFTELMKYGSSHQSPCWIIGTHALLLSFGLPVALLLVINVVLFIRCVVGIYKARKIASRARHRDSKNDLIVYIKMASLMGFTWTFGFLANVVQIQAFWYIFIVLNSLQGVFIFLSFTLKSSILRMYFPKASTSEKYRESINTVSQNMSESNKSTEVLRVKM